MVLARRVCIHNRGRKTCPQLTVVQVVPAVQESETIIAFGHLLAIPHAAVPVGRGVGRERLVLDRIFKRATCRPCPDVSFILDFTIGRCA